MRSVWICVFAFTAVFAGDPNLQPSQYRIDHWGPGQGLPEESVTGFAQDRDGFLWIATLHGLIRFDGEYFSKYLPPPTIPANFRNVAVDGQTGTLWLSTVKGAVVGFNNGRFERKPDWAAIEPAAVTPLSGQPLVLGARHTLVPGAGALLAAPWVPSPLDGKISAVFRFRDATWAGLADGRVGPITGAPGARWHALAALPGGPVLAIDARADTLWALTAAGVWEHRPSGDAFHPLAGATCLRSSPDGSLWIGTATALYRKAPGAPIAPVSIPELPADRVEALFIDDAQNLWVAMVSSGLFRLAPTPFRNWGPPEGLAAPIVRAAIESRAGDVWLSYSTGQLQRLVHGVPQTVAVPGIVAPIQNFAEDAAGILWAFGRDAAFRIDPSGPTVRRLNPSPDAGSFRGVFYSPQAGAIRILTDRGLWTVTSGGALQPDPVAGLPLPIDANAQIQESPNGDRWLCARSGIFRIHASTATRIPFQWEHPDVAFPFACYADQAGDLWVGMNGGGLLRVRGNTVARLHSRPPDQGFYTFGLGEDKAGNLWLALRSGLMRLPKNTLNAFLDEPSPSAPPASQLWDTRHGLRSANFGRTLSTLGASGPAARLWFVHLKGALSIETALVDAPGDPPRPYLQKVRLGATDLPLTNGAAHVPSSSEPLRFDVRAAFISPRTTLRFRSKLAGLSDLGHPPSHRGACEIDIKASLPPPVRSLVLRICEAGWLFRRVSQFTKSRSALAAGGLVLQGFISGIHDELSE